jgi:hypothetical protein
LPDRVILIAISLVGGGATFENEGQLRQHAQSFRSFDRCAQNPFSRVESHVLISKEEKKQRTPMLIA